MKQILLIIMMLMLASVSLAVTPTSGTLMPVKCDGSAATDTFNESEDPCVYGVGFDADSSVDIILEDETQVVATTSESTNSNGIISLRNIWSNLTKGIYTFFADLNNNGQADEGESKQSLFVIGEANQENPQEIVDEQPVEEVPEFGVIASFIVLLTAGIFIHKKRGSQQ